MFGIKQHGDLFTTFGQFPTEERAYKFGFAEFGDLIGWDVVPVNH
jgi:hypothetical protein